MKYAFVVGIIVLILGAIWYAFSRGLSQDQELLPIPEQINGLKIEEIVVGAGTEAKTGNTVSVHYTGTLFNGTKFDSSLDHGEPFSFTIGQGSVIQGWEQGIPGMKVGGKRKLTIPPALAYGDRAVGNAIPANSTLVFEVELLSVQ